MSSTVRCGGSATAWTGICITPSLVASSLIAEAPTVIFPERCCGSCNSISPKSAGLNVQTSPSNVPLLKFDPAGNVITLTTSPLDEPDIPSLADRRRGTGVSSAPPTDESVRMGGSTGGRSGEAWVVVFSLAHSYCILIATLYNYIYATYLYSLIR